MKTLLNIKEAADLLKVTQSNLKKSLDQFDIPHHKFGNEFVFLKEDLDNWLFNLLGQKVDEIANEIDENIQSTEKEEKKGKKEIQFTTEKELPDQEFEISSDYRLLLNKIYFQFIGHYSINLTMSNFIRILILLGNDAINNLNKKDKFINYINLSTSEKDINKISYENQSKD